ncbi:hypothetical protein U5801_27835, partial [Lamprobacter modestohalophilus]|uniref:hypothetical protein n=1 Tax=Lamprobacter modestohalophilus TaxID=1064514 RepID=UPI002ADEE8D4
RFVTVTTSLLAVYALTGRLMFGSLLPVEGFSDGVQLVLAALVLLSLLVSWGFAFRAMQIQGIQKAPLNNSMLEFAKSNNVQTFYYAMSKAYGKYLLQNREINDAKADNIKKSFWSIVSTVVFFTIYIVWKCPSTVSRFDCSRYDRPIMVLRSRISGWQRLTS